MAKPILLVKLNPKVYAQDQMEKIKECLKMTCFDYHCFAITSTEVTDIEFQVHGIVDSLKETIPPLPLASDVKRGVS